MFEDCGRFLLVSTTGHLAGGFVFASYAGRAALWPSTE